MITLALGQILWGLAYRWASLTNGDNGVNVRHGRRRSASASTRRRVLSTRRSSSSCSPRRDGDLRALALRRQPARHARPAAAHERARLQRLADPLHRLRVLGLLDGVAGLLFVYYNQFISPQAMALQTSAEVLLMVISGGAGTLLGPVVGAALVVDHEERGQRLYRALEFGARRDLRRHRHLHAGRPRARASVRLWRAAGAPARRRARRRAPAPSRRRSR